MNTYIVYSDGDEFTIEVPDDARVDLQHGTLRVVNDVVIHEKGDFGPFVREHVLAQHPCVETIRCTYRPSP